MAISPIRSGQCRGADSRARRRTCNLYKPPSKWQTLPTCHCEGALRPWQSRRHVAANVGERTAGPGDALVICTNRRQNGNAPDLSLRGAKRRGNLAVLCWISRKLRRKRNCFPEIAPQGHFLALRAQGATAPSGPRNDKSGSIAPLNSCHQYCQPAWRSLSAATDAIGRCVFIDTLHELEVPSRDCHVASLLAMTI